jgi:hypothetical protein
MVETTEHRRNWKKMAEIAGDGRVALNAIQSLNGEKCH